MLAVVVFLLLFYDRLMVKNWYKMKSVWKHKIADHPDVAYLAMVENAKKFESGLTAADPTLKAKMDAVLKEGVATFNKL